MNISPYRLGKALDGSFPDHIIFRKLDPVCARREKYAVAAVVVGFYSLDLLVARIFDHERLSQLRLIVNEDPAIDLVSFRLDCEAKQKKDADQKCGADFDLEFHVSTSRIR